MLGVSGTHEDAAVINTLGRLEELTLSPSLPYPTCNQAARRLPGLRARWRRRTAITTPSTAWLTLPTPPSKPGCSAAVTVSGVMDEEVAYIAASTGGLAEALAGAVDEELLDWSGRLLVALAMGGPAKDMSDYADGATALDAYLREVGNVSATLQRLQHLYDLERYLTGWAAENPLIDDGTRQALSTRVTEILNRPKLGPHTSPAGSSAPTSPP